MIMNEIIPLNKVLFLYIIVNILHLITHYVISYINEITKIKKTIQNSINKLIINIIIDFNEI